MMYKLGYILGKLIPIGFYATLLTDGVYRYLHHESFLINLIVFFYFLHQRMFLYSIASYLEKIEYTNLYTATYFQNKINQEVSEQASDWEKIIANYRRNKEKNK